MTKSSRRPWPRLMFSSHATQRTLRSRDSRLRNSNISESGKNAQSSRKEPIRTRNSRGRFTWNKHSGKAGVQNTGISNRLRKRKSPLPQLPNKSSQSRRITRSKAQEEWKGRKRNAKSIEKEASDSSGDGEELKISPPVWSVQRQRYFSQGNAIYQEYDDFLKRKRKDKRAEFGKITKDPGEEPLNPKNNKDLLKYFGAANEDTFWYWNTVSYDEMIAWDNPKCPIEWFHFAWVGLDSKPNKQWFCNICKGKTR